MNAGETEFVRDGPDPFSGEWKAGLPGMVRGILGGGPQAKNRALTEILPGNARLTDVVNIFVAVMTGIYRYAKTYGTADADEVVALLTLLRIHNSMTTGIELALQGYPQQAIALQRDVFECVTLAEWFVHDRTSMRRWAASTVKDRMSGEFKQGKLRTKLDEFGGLKKGEPSDRQRIYDYQSEAGAHFTPGGLNLVVSGEKFILGPLLDPGQLIEAFQGMNSIGERVVRKLPSLFPKAPEELRQWTAVQNRLIHDLYSDYERKYPADPDDEPSA